MLGVLQPKEKLCDAPLHLPSSVACCYGNSRQWNGLSLEKKKKHRAPTPLSLCSLPLASSPTFVSQRSFIHQKTVLAKRACRPPGSSPRWQDWYTVARWWRAAQYLPMSGLLVHIALNGAYLSLIHLRKSRLETVISSRLLYVPPLPWNPSSAPVVSLCESRWLQQSEKCLEFANPGLWASSCLAFFFFFSWPGIYSSVSAVWAGFRSITRAQLHDEVPACWTSGCTRYRNQYLGYSTQNSFLTRLRCLMRMWKMKPGSERYCFSCQRFNTIHFLTPQQ